MCSYILGGESGHLCLYIQSTNRKILVISESIHSFQIYFYFDY